jgi:hypothetical protein
VTGDDCRKALIRVSCGSVVGADSDNLLLAGRSNAGGGMDEETELTLKIHMDRKKYAWSLHRNGVSEPIKYSVPIFSTEAAATAAGLQVLTRINLRKK